MPDSDVPPERCFASLEEIERLAERHPSRVLDIFELGQRVMVGGRPALIMSVEHGVASSRRMRFSIDVRYLDEPV